MLGIAAKHHPAMARFSRSHSGEAERVQRCHDDSITEHVIMIVMMIIMYTIYIYIYL
jgi:hypothetical protein